MNVTTDKSQVDHGPRQAVDKADGKKSKGSGLGYPVVVGGAIALGLLAIVSTSFSGGQYSLTLADMVQDQEAYVDKDLRVTGDIKASSTQIIEVNGEMQLHFVLTNGQGAEAAVIYPHNPPDPYKEGREAIIEGKMRADGVILAHKLTVKCPSKYQTEGSTMDPAMLDEYRKKYGPSASGAAGAY